VADINLWPISTLPVADMVLYVANMVVADMVCGRYRCNSVIIIRHAVFIAFNINHSSILPLMALNSLSLYCADVPLSNYSLTHSLTRVSFRVRVTNELYFGTCNVNHIQ